MCGFPYTRGLARLVQCDSNAGHDHFTQRYETARHPPPRRARSPAHRARRAPEPKHQRRPEQHERRQLGPVDGRSGGRHRLSLELPPAGLNAGPRFTGELMYGYMDLSPQARLSLGGRGAFSYHSDDFNGSLWIVEAVPDAKVTLALAPSLSVYGDLGIGLAVLATSADSTLAATFQFGGGVSYAVSPTMNLLGELRFDIYTRSGSSTFISIPTIGLQFH